MAPHTPFRRIAALLTATLICFASLAVNTLRADSPLPYRGLAIAAPSPQSLDRFIQFVDTELAPRGINLLILRVDYRFAYQSNPELQSDNPLSLADVKKLVAMGKRHGIRLIPQINLLGHQSWHSSLGRLLSVYPEFDETPGVKLPPEGEYKWPNEDGLYCKSYCPLHPEVHSVVFPLVDELLDAFEADAFHAGLDEVFFLAHPDCPRCSGKDPAELFAGEVNRIQQHLAQSDRELWMWGDRLLDADTTGLGIWEASDSGSHRAIDLISRDVVICDWHYERAEATPIYFATQGYRVMACPWNKPAVGLAQLEQAIDFREHSNEVLGERHLGVLHTYWSGADRFMNLYESLESAAEDDRDYGPIRTLNAIFPKD